MILSTKPDKEEFFAQKNFIWAAKELEEEEFNSDDLFELDFSYDQDDEIGAEIDAFRSIRH